MVEAALLVGRYRIEERVAGGGMGTVYVARDELLGRRVAAKLLHEDLADNPSFVDRFRREARSVAALVHPNIATVFDYGEDEGRHFIVMELVDGRDLERILNSDGALAPTRARGIAAKVCEALGHAHAAGVVHRDVKPANVIVSADDAVKVTDFGIARVADDAAMTATGAVLGTAQYIAPEQASDGPVGPPTDVYSMGIMLFEMLTGRRPFVGGSPVAVAMRHIHEDVPAPSSVNRAVPAELDAIVLQATQKDPRRRFAGGTEMARALNVGVSAATRVMSAGRPTAVLSPPPPTTDEMPAAEWPPPRGTRRGRRAGPVVAMIALLVALAGIGLAAYSLTQDDARPRRPEAPARPQEQESPSPEEEATVVVPEGLVGATVSNAVALLRGAGLTPATQNVTDAAEQGTVVAANPSSGTPVASGSTVTLSVSTGPPEPEPTPTQESPTPTEEPPPDQQPPQGDGAAGGDG
jgi:tRNA A-37 threonylcarbamoyl transferase component Bud32